MRSFKNFSLPGGNEAWKAAAGIFLISRCIIFICTYMGWSRLIVNNPIYGQETHECLKQLGLCLQSWNQFDAQHFLGIAYYGYGGYHDYQAYNPQHPYAAAFFPLYPLLIHSLGFLFGGSFIADYVASLLIANICFFLAMIVLYCLVRQDFDDSIARGSLFFLAFNPFALFFFFGYSEPLFLLLCLGVLFLLRRGRSLDWWLAGLCGAGAVLTRGSGIILLLVFFLAFLQRFWPTLCASLKDRLLLFKEGRWRKMLNMLLPMGLLPLALAGYMLYLWLNWHDPLLFSHGEEYLWRRHLNWPWVGTIETIQSLLFTTQGRDARNLTDLLFTITPLAIIATGWKRLPLDYLVFSLAIALFSLMYPWPIHALASAPRFLLVLFPVGVMLALWSKKRPTLGKMFEVIWITFFVINTLLFVLWNWVA